MEHRVWNLLDYTKCEIYLIRHDLKFNIIQNVLCYFNVDVPYKVWYLRKELFVRFVLYLPTLNIIMLRKKLIFRVVFFVRSTYIRAYMYENDRWLVLFWRIEGEVFEIQFSQTVAGNINSWNPADRTLKGCFATLPVQNPGALMRRAILSLKD